MWASRMYRMPEKQTGSWTVSNCAQCCFYQYANHLPFRLLSIKLKYRGFLMTSRFVVFHFMLILKRMNSFMWIYAFKREKFQGNVLLQPQRYLWRSATSWQLGTKGWVYSHTPSCWMARLAMYWPGSHLSLPEIVFD